MQLERWADGVVPAGGALLFDSVASSSGSISYNSVTGIITISQPGKYEVNWWIATQASAAQNRMEFALETSQGDTFAAGSPVKTTEIMGMGILEVETAPLDFRLYNYMAQPAYLPNTVFVKAGLIIMEIVDATAGLEAYGGIYGDVATPITLTAGVDEILTLAESMASSNVVLSSDSITIQADGDYQVNYMLMLQSTTGSFGLSCGVVVNGDYLLSTITSLALGSDFEHFSVGVIVPLSAGDVVRLALNSATGGGILLGPALNATLSVMKISI